MTTEHPHPDLKAFMPEAFDVLPPAVQHEIALGHRARRPLEGLSLAVKDVFDVAGLVTGVGSPLWAAQQRPADHTAVAPLALLRAGACWKGKTVTDELTYSLAGINVHYGTPTNPRYPHRLPGGSSSGSAVAVAAGLADIGLGTDCGGSIRLPASYCGLWGMRPTHGRIAMQGCFSLAHSFDTVGWCARDPQVLAACLEVLAHTDVGLADQPNIAEAAPELLVSEDVMALLGAPVLEALQRTVERLRARHTIRMLPRSSFDLAQAQTAFRTLQGAEVAQQHGAWFDAHGHSMGADVRQRFAWAQGVSPAEVAEAQALRRALSVQLTGLLGQGAMLLLPTVPDMAIGVQDSAEAVDAARQRALRTLCLAGLAGLPQVSMPWFCTDEGAVGLSLVSVRGDDERVVRTAARLSQALAEGRGD